VDPSTVLGIAAAVATFVFVDVLFVEVRRCVRELQRIVRRLRGYAELPIVSLAAAATYDVARLNAGAARMTELLSRGEAALKALRLR
jgi:hypothetical protein